jgi:hypothetical protein
MNLLFVLKLNWIMILLFIFLHVFIFREFKNQFKAIKRKSILPFPKSFYIAPHELFNAARKSNLLIYQVISVIYFLLLFLIIIVTLIKIFFNPS